MADFALRIATYIDTTKEYYLVGVSLGGMIATEIAHHYTPSKTIIISSAKNKNELPVRYRFQRHIPIYNIIPPKLLKKGALFLQPLVESDRNKYESTFISMLSSKSPEYFQASISLIVNWQRETCSADIIHIHGTNDHTIPIKNIMDPIIIKDGSHMMTLTLYDEVQKNLEPFL
jgi:esterase/lipase